MPGARTRRSTRASGGRVVGAQPVRAGERNFEVALTPSLLATVRRGALGAGIAAVDLHKKIRYQVRRQLVVFVVDASESMGEGARARMAAAKGAALALLRDAYVTRCRVALVAFRGERAEVLLPPTRSIDLARERLRCLPAGGATPFAGGLWLGWRLIRRERARTSWLRPLLVVISDGEANVALQPGRDIMDELLEIAGGIRRDEIPSLVIDSRPAGASGTEMALLAKALGTDCHHLGSLRSRQVFDLVRDTGGRVAD